MSIYKKGKAVYFSVFFYSLFIFQSSPPLLCQSINLQYYSIAPDTLNTNLTNTSHTHTAKMGSVTQSKLFEPLQVGPNQLSNRLVMAPLTRFRADDNHVPLPMVKEYYAQRASVPGTLLITEATIINEPAGGYPNVPQIFSDEQIAAWKEIADAVHEKGSFLWLQLWALGRVADQEYKRSTGSGDLVSSSDVPVAEGAPAPRPLTEDEIQERPQQTTWTRTARSVVNLAPSHP